MKFINYLTDIAGIEIFPMISLLLFFTFFITLGIYLIRADKERIKYIEALPLENDAPNNNSNSQQ